MYVRERLDSKLEESWNYEIEILKTLQEIPNFFSQKLLYLLEKEDERYMVLEWTEGNNLKHFNFSKNYFKEETNFIFLIIFLSQQLYYLHSKSLIHGRISPKNILSFEKGKNPKNIFFLIKKKKKKR